MLLVVLGRLHARKEEKGSAPWHLEGVCDAGGAAELLVLVKCHQPAVSRVTESRPWAGSALEEVCVAGEGCSRCPRPGQTACSFASAECTAFLFSQIPLFPRDYFLPGQVWVHFGGA